jgi:iron-sulfur cluster repair protein YtfE (RIC family)
MTVTAALHDEHLGLLPHVEQLRTAAEAVDDLPPLRLAALLDEALRFLRDDLVPHATAEDDELYPVVEEVMEAPGATATMRRDHVEIARLVDELGALTARLHATPSVTDPHGLRRVLYGLYAVIRLHLAKEEELYLPLLDAGLSAQRAERVLGLMGRAAAEVRAGA